MWCWSVGMKPWHFANIPVGLFNTEHFSSANISAQKHETIKSNGFKNYNINRELECDRSSMSRLFKFSSLFCRSHPTWRIIRFLINNWYHCPCWCKASGYFLSKLPNSKTWQNAWLSSRRCRCWWRSHRWCRCCCCHKDLKESPTVNESNCRKYEMQLAS